MRALLTLVPLSAFCGFVTAFVFRRFGSSGTKQTVNRILAHVMELRLFLDEPAVIWRAQRDLIRENLRLFRQIAIPCLIAAPFFALVMWQADRIYGRAPLRAGEAVVVTAHGVAGDPQLQAPAGVVVETPGVRIPGKHEVSWRIRPSLPFSGKLSMNVDIPWPRAKVLGLSWMVWFFGISAIAALIAPRFLKRYAAMLLLAVSAHAEKPPVILISIDTLRADRVTKLLTPNIEAFAEKGTIWTQIDSQIPLTLPSHTSLMTSTYPFTNRVEVNGENVPPGAITLASVLRDNGYKTAAFIGSAILDKRYGLDQGFDVYDSPFGTERVRRDASLVIAGANRWLAKNRREPVFAFLHIYDLHTPYTLPGVTGLMPTAAGYGAELAYIDQALGRFRQALIRDGWWDKSLVILLADHGESLGDHGETSHGYFVYESTMHVPLIVHWPTGAPQYPERIDQPGGLIDVAPTVLDFLHLAAPPSFAGASLLPGHSGRPVYGESMYPHETFGWATLRALRSGQFKYIQAPKPELYDIAKDPGERTNLLHVHPQEAHSMNAQIGDLLASFAPKQPQSPIHVSEHTREVLGSLGYTAGGRPAALQGTDPKDKLAEQEAYENGLAFLYTGRYDKAILTLKRVVAGDARNLPALCALADAYRRSGDAVHARALAPQCVGRQ